MAEPPPLSPFKAAAPVVTGTPGSGSAPKSASESSAKEFVPATPGTVSPETREANNPGAPVHSTGLGRVQQVVIKPADTPVAIIGFSGSGKTIYLTMLYYATHVMEKFREGWEANWVATDEGATYRYLNDIYRTIVGLNSDGSVKFDKTGRRVMRAVPGGTTEQSVLQFSMTRSTGVGDQVLKIITIDGAGEVLHRYASNPEIFSGDPNDPAKAGNIDLVQFGPRWEQLRRLCESSRAIMLFFSLLKSFPKYVYTAEVRTLVEVLIKQKQKPSAVVFVLTGTDILPDENAVEQKKTEFITLYGASLRRLEAEGVEWDVFMVSNFGRGFTRKKDPEGLSDDCKNHHRCALCQELTNEPTAQPEPVNLAEPWEFVYEKVFSDSAPIAVGKAIARWARDHLLNKAALFGAILLPIAYAGWVLASGWQDSRALTEKLTPPVSREKALEAVKLDRSLNSHAAYRWLFPSDAGGANSPRSQVHRLGEAMALYEDPKRLPAERLAAAEAVVKQLGDEYKELVPLASLRLDAELAQITRPGVVLPSGKTDVGSPAYFADLVKRVQAGNAALKKTDRRPEDRPRIVQAVEELMTETARQLDLLMKWLDQAERQPAPQFEKEGERLAAFQALQAALEDRGGVRGLTSQPIATVLQRLPSVLNELAICVDFARVLGEAEETPEQRRDKIAHLVAFSQRYRDHPLRSIADFRRVMVGQKDRDLMAEVEFRKLPAYDSKVQNFPSFVDAYRRNAAFLQDYAQSETFAKMVRTRLAEMTSVLEDREIVPLRKRSDETLANLRLRDQDSKRGPEAWDSDLRQSAAELAALKQLMQVTDVPDGAKIGQTLESIVQLQGGYAELARVLGAPTTDETSLAAKAKLLEQFVRKQAIGSPVANAAMAAHSESEDELLRVRMTTELAALAPPDQASLTTPNSGFQSTLLAYDQFLADKAKQLAAPAREQRFKQYLASKKLADPIREARERRDRIQLKFDEKRDWESVSQAATGRSNLSDKAAILAKVDQFLQKYPNSEKASAAKALRTEVDNWRSRELKLAIQFLDMTVLTPHSVSMTIRPEGPSPALFQRTFPVTRGHLAPDADKNLVFTWNTAQKLVFEVRLLNAQGGEVWREEVAMPPEEVMKKLTAVFRKNTLSFKLDAVP